MVINNYSNIRNDDDKYQNQNKSLLKCLKWFPINRLIPFVNFT